MQTALEANDHAYFAYSRHYLSCICSFTFLLTRAVLRLVWPATVSLQWARDRVATGAKIVTASQLVKQRK